MTLHEICLCSITYTLYNTLFITRFHRLYVYHCNKDME